MIGQYHCGCLITLDPQLRKEEHKVDHGADAKTSTPNLPPRWLACAAVWCGSRFALTVDESAKRPQHPAIATQQTCATIIK